MLKCGTAMTRAKGAESAAMHHIGISGSMLHTSKIHASRVRVIRRDTVTTVVQHIKG